MDSDLQILFVFHDDQGNRKSKTNLFIKYLITVHFFCRIIILLLGLYSSFDMNNICFDFKCLIIFSFSSLYHLCGRARVGGSRNGQKEEHHFLILKIETTTERFNRKRMCENERKRTNNKVINRILLFGEI